MFRARYRGQSYATGFGGYQPGLAGSAIPNPTPVARAASIVSAETARTPNEGGPPVRPVGPTGSPQPRGVTTVPGPGGSTIITTPQGSVFIILPNGQAVPYSPDVIAQLQQQPDAQAAAPAAAGAPAPQTGIDPTGSVTPIVESGLPQPQPTPTPTPQPQPTGSVNPIVESGAPPAVQGAQPNGDWLGAQGGNVITLPPDEFGQPQYQTPDGIVHVVDPQTGIELGRSPWPVANPTAPSNQWRPAQAGEQPNLQPGAPAGQPINDNPPPEPNPNPQGVPPGGLVDMGYAGGGRVQPGMASPTPTPPPTAPQQPAPAPGGGGYYGQPDYPITQNPYAPSPLGDQTMPPPSGASVVPYTGQSALGAPYVVSPAPQNPYAPSPLGDQTYPPSQYPPQSLGPPGWDVLDPTLPIPHYPDPYAASGGGNRLV